MNRAVLAGALCLGFAGCASQKCHQRGWIGGEFEPVDACGRWYESAPSYERGAVVGMPAGSAAQTGLLLLRAPGDSPLACAGVHEGDLLVGVDDRPVADAVSLRREVEGRTPGSTLVLDVWRDGESRHVPVQVGRETYERVLTLGFILLPTTQADLWPFDDGFDVFGLVTAKSSSARHDLDGPERTYLAHAMPGQEPGPVTQESSRVHVWPLTMGTRKRILEQERVVAMAP